MTARLRYLPATPTEEQSALARQSPLYAVGDMSLIWVNQGDLNDLETGVTPGGAACADTTPWNFADFLDRKNLWSAETFGPVEHRGPLGPLDHLRKEIEEAAATPDDVAEFADLVFLATDAAFRAGHTPAAIITGLEEKLTVNRNRIWPDWTEASADKAIEHVRDDDELCLPDFCPSEDLDRAWLREAMATLARLPERPKATGWREEAYSAAFDVLWRAITEYRWQDLPEGAVTEHLRESSKRALDAAATYLPPPGQEDGETLADRAALTSVIEAADEREEALRAENAELRDALGDMLPSYIEMVEECGHDPSVGIDCSKDFARIEKARSALSQEGE